MNELIHRSGAETVAIAWRNLVTGDELLIHPDDPFHPASTFKLCVLMELHHQAQAGALDLDGYIPIVNEFHSIVDGSPFSLDRQDDSELTLYSHIGEAERYRELARLMMVHSSNLATNILLGHLTPERVTSFMHALGARGILVRRGVEDNKAFALGFNNVATARGFAILLQRLAQRAVVSPQASDEMIQLLLAQHFREGIPALLPEEAHVAHKTGWNNQLYHDVAIVYPPDRSPYVLVIMTRGIEQDAVAHQLVASISKLLYEQVGM